ncbi:MAG: leucyl aminopeptidase family protein [Gammaproteobacteria bacterium]|nr:leucyl aminopeptidase family protein [Gammaproteobacteria bacterium]
MNIHNLFCDTTAACIPIELVTEDALAAYSAEQTEAVRNTITAQQFKAKPYNFCVVYAANGTVQKVIVGYKVPSIWSIAGLPLVLPMGNYQIHDLKQAFDKIPLELGWALGAYQFTRYKAAKREPAKLAIRNNQDKAFLTQQVEAIFMLRDMINTPAEDMTPAILADAAIKVADQFGAKHKVIVGDELLKQNFPTIHRVGRAAEGTSAPRLIEFTWGKATDKKLTLVGKGVCFDTGGLDLKPSSNMLLMKKDMGGAAHVLALAYLIMAQKLPVQLTILIPAVENSVAGNAMRPSDIVKTRKGLTVEIGNTDAEGRLILSDALAYACESKPDLIIDFATLTGARTVALGPSIAALLTPNQTLANDLLVAAQAQDDPLWQLPLYADYRPYMDSLIADINNTSRSPYGGCITAGLFLAEFVTAETPWAHFDLNAYNTEPLPGRPIGGEAQGVRAVYQYIVKNF